jgi:predicted nucleotide-binding protein
MDTSALIQSLLEEVAKLPHRDSAKLDALRKRARMILTKIFGSDSSYVADLESIHFFPTVAWSGMGNEWHERSWRSGSSELTNLLKTAVEDLELSQPPHTTQRDQTLGTKTNKKSNRIFVVHGHDNEMKLSVARTLEKLGLEPIILHEQPDKGLTVIEKFINFADVGFAVVLLSPDDLSLPKNGNASKARPRARQNVVFELGFFLGKLGRERVVALHKPAPDFEMPSDYGGVLYKAFDDAGAWKYELAKELKANSYAVDANNLI